MKLALLLFLALSARADVINLSLVSSTVTGAPGTTVTFTGTLANTSGADININGASLTLATFDPSASDLTDFILNATGLLANGTSLGPVDFFTVTIPNAFATGLYGGTLTVQGGTTENDDANLATTNFQVNVQPAGSSPVPEPSTWGLVTIALALCAAKRLTPERS
jgi:hypothetical protein